MASISKYDFDFQKTGHGVYEVTFTSPKTSKEWTAKITDMELVDNTKNEEFPLVKYLNELKRSVKLYSE